MDVGSFFDMDNESKTIQNVDCLLHCGQIATFLKTDKWQKSAEIQGFQSL